MKLRSIKAAFVEGALIKKTLAFIKKTPERIDFALGNAVRTLWSRSGKIQNNKIVFMTYSNNYICNPKYIAEELLKTPEKYDLVWICSGTGEGIPRGIRRAKRGSFDAYCEMRSAKIWIDNSLNFVWKPFFKKKGQVYFETWHGSLGIKRFGKDDNKDGHWVARAKKCGKETDFCISNSQFENGVFRETFWPKTKILMFGHARNDILFCQGQKQKEIKGKVFDFFEVFENEKILLYAPTFRNSGDESAYDIDFALLKDALEKKFGGSWKILYRNHFHYRKKKFKTKYAEFVLNATSYPDMQELLVASDAGISDYSSWLCDFVLTKKPAFIYAPDICDYESERGFYYPLETSPFSIAQSNEELAQNILNFDCEKYKKRCEEFLAEKGCVEDGHAAERVVKKIDQIIAGGSSDKIDGGGYYRRKNAIARPPQFSDANFKMARRAA